MSSPPDAIAAGAVSSDFVAEIVRPEMAELRKYVPAQGEWEVRLDANEAPALLDEQARARLAAVAAETRWERYPDATMRELRAAIARRVGVDPDRVVAGVGSDEIITLLYTVFVRPRSRAPTATVVTTTPTFVMYRMSARSRGLKVVEVPLDAAWDLSLPSLERAVEMARPNLVMVASPNNPTSNQMSLDRLRALAELARDALVVVDEAYVDYSDRDQLVLLREHDNVAILRTLSKIGFAALRVGWLVARPDVVELLDTARQPYNVSTLSQRLATCVLDDLGDEVQSATRRVVEERRRIADALARTNGVSCARSDSNFLWIRTERPAAEVFAGLAEGGVLVRSFHGRGGRLENHLRVTVGTPAENDRFLARLTEVL